MLAHQTTSRVSYCFLFFFIILIKHMDMKKFSICYQKHLLVHSPLKQHIENYSWKCFDYIHIINWALQTNNTDIKYFGPTTVAIMLYYYLCFMLWNTFFEEFTNSLVTEKDTKDVNENTDEALPFWSGENDSSRFRQSLISENVVLREETETERMDMCHPNG